MPVFTVRHEHHHFYHYSPGARDEVMRRLEDIDQNMTSSKETIMTAIDDLKTSIAALISESTNDITTLINNAANNSNDPKIQQLKADVDTATKNLHDQFTAATGTPVPPPTA